MNTTEGSVFGAALLVGVGASFWDNVEKACQAVIRVEQRTQPNPVAVQAYEQHHPLFQDLYRVLKLTFDVVGLPAQEM